METQTPTLTQETSTADKVAVSMMNLERMVEMDSYLKEDLEKIGSLIGELGELVNSGALTEEQAKRLQQLQEENEAHMRSTGASGL